MSPKAAGLHSGLILLLAVLLISRREPSTTSNLKLWFSHLLKHEALSLFIRECCEGLYSFQVFLDDTHFWLTLFITSKVSLIDLNHCSLGHALICRRWHIPWFIPYKYVILIHFAPSTGLFGVKEPSSIRWRSGIC